MNQNEYAALLDDNELCHEARLVYLCFRRFMDYSTGITGMKRVVDYNELSQSIEYHPVRGSKDKAKYYSRDQIKRLIQQLVKRGFLVPLHKKGIPGQKMIFQLPLANTDSVRPDEERHLSATEAPPQEHPVFMRGAEDMSAQGAPQEERRISVISDITTNTEASETKFAMRSDWQPSNLFNDLCRRSGINPDDEESKNSVGPFVAYYLSKPGRTENRARWDSLLINWILRERAQIQSMGGRNHGKQLTNNSGSSARATEAAQAIADATRDLSDESWAGPEYDRFG